MEAMRQATEYKSTATEGVWYSAKEYDPETASIKEQIENSRASLNQMQPVANETVPTSFANRRSAKEWATELLRKTGYQVDRQNFGVITYSESDIENALAHTTEAEQQAALAALPRVLKRGIQIGEHGNHKGRGKHTVTFAGPVVLNGQRGNMAVVVNRNGNHFYASQIVTPDGSTYRFSDKEKTQRVVGVQGVAENSSLAGPQNSASSNSISNSPEKSNPQSNEITGRQAFSLKEDVQAKVDRATRMLDNGSTYGEVFKETGLVINLGGEIQDGFDGPVIGRYERGRDNEGPVVPMREGTESARREDRRGMEESLGASRSRSWGELRQSERWGVEQSLQIAEDVYGEEIAVFRSQQDDSANERKNARGEGADRRSAFEADEGRISYSLKRPQTETEKLLRRQEREIEELKARLADARRETRRTTEKEVNPAQLRPYKSREVLRLLETYCPAFSPSTQAVLPFDAYLFPIPPIF